MCNFSNASNELYQVCSCGKHVWCNHASRLVKIKHGAIRITDAVGERRVINLKHVVVKSRAKLLFLLFLIALLLALVYSGFDYTEYNADKLENVWQDFITKCRSSYQSV